MFQSNLPDNLQNATITETNFSAFTYSQKSHFVYFKDNDFALFHRKIDKDNCDLKVYQDLIVYTFILENIPKGSVILEVGGGDSRVLSAIKCDYDCWNIDRLEGCGSGPTSINANGFHLVKAYMGEFTEELPNDYFDLVFSISALEHVEEEKKAFQNICLDIDRVLKPGGYSLHCFDVVLKKDQVWTNKLLHYMFENYETTNSFIPLMRLRYDEDLYFMSKQAYVRGWQQITKKSYEEFGAPVSYNILWKKKNSKWLKPDPKNKVKRDSNRICKKNENIDMSAKKMINRRICKLNLNAPKITIVTPSYNQSKFLEECIDSILSQNYPNLEYIIMDGGSTDGSVEIIKKYEKYLAFWKSEPDAGQYDAINQGFGISTGQILAWLNSDDKYHENALIKAAYLFQKYPLVEWITGRPTAWNEKGKLVRIFEDLPLWSREKYLRKVFRTVCIQQESTFWRKSLWQKSGAYLETGLEFAGDLELWVRFFRFAKLFTVDTLLGGYRYQPEQKTNLNLGKYIEEGQGIIDKEIRKIRAGRFSDILPAPPPLPFNKYDFEIYKDYILSQQIEISKRGSQKSCGDPFYFIRQIESTSKINSPKINIAAEKRCKIKIATSIAPKEIDLQIQAIKSWRKLGFNIVSINCQEEIDLVQKFFPDIEFHHSKRNAKKQFGKPFIFLDDIFSYFRKTNSEICGIVNSDIYLYGDNEIASLIQNETQNAVLYGHRVEIDSIDNLKGSFYDQGFDFFFFPQSVLSCFPESDHCLGVTWWDYWAGLIPALEGFELKKLISPFAFHLTHPIRYDDKQWNAMGERVWNFLFKKSRQNIISQISEVRWSIFDSIISNTGRPCQTLKNLTTLNNAKNRLLKLEDLAVAIQSFLKEVSTPIHYCEHKSAYQKDSGKLKNSYQKLIATGIKNFDKQEFNQKICIGRHLASQNKFSDGKFFLAKKINRGIDSETIEVSAIISAFNSERFMRGRLENLVKQTLFTKGKLEIIIVDSNSGQDEKKIVNQFIDKYRNIEYVYTSETETVYGAWNRGIRYARGNYIINANADDRFALDALERMAEELDSDPSVQAVYGDWVVTRTENDSLESNSAKFLFSYPEFFPPLLFYYQITSHACLLRKEIFARIGPFDHQLRVFGDREFMFRFSIAGLKAKRMAFNAGLYLQNPASLEHSNTGAGAEFSSMRDLYIQPRLISRLFGYESIPHDKKLADLYAFTGSLGKDFYTWDKKSVSDFNFAARLFSKALALDPTNGMALNNLGIIMSLKGKPQEGVRQFEKALEGEAAAIKTNIKANLKAAKEGAASIGSYWWYRCESMDQGVCAENNNRSSDDHQGPVGAIRTSSNEFVFSGSTNNSFMVSVIVPTFNRPEMLPTALNSLASQTFSDFEVIVINDGGVNIDPIIADFKDRFHIQYIDYPVNCNRAAARNKGIRIADGKYIAYLDDDDRLYPEHLEVLVGYLESNDCQMAYTDAYRAVEEKRQKTYVVVKRDLPHSTEFDDERILVRNFIPSLCVMHEKACLESIGLFDESLGTHEDWDLWIRLSRQFKVTHVRQTTGEYSWRTDGSSTTSGCREDFLQTMKTVYRKHKELAAGNPRILEEQRKSLESLKNEISGTRQSIECSIIIPVFNNLEYTRKCIEALFKNTIGMRFEVIVVNNDSGDGTKEFLSSIEDKLTVITNNNNQGFAKACNQGASAAQGHWVIFLNNDTEVQAGWLNELVNCCQQDDDIGAVGAKLLYPDNTIQHAGVAIKNSPHPIFPYHIHRGKKASSPEVNATREYQAVTGACMLLKKRVFTEIGGFDEAFLNGYEDIDLCFRLRESGYKILYCPASVVYHHESVSRGRFANADQNIRRLHQKWQNKIVPDIDVREIQRNDKLSSVVILTHNQIEYTKKCLESIYKHTPEPFELIIVDNGSTDGTPQYLESEFVGRPSGVEVKVIKNIDNLGFSAGNNQGISAARGDYIVLLNNDVVVTRGWLRRLIGCADQNPNTGIVGPRTNSAAGPQRVDQVPYNQQNLEGLDDFAALRAAKFRGKSTDCWRIVGFCMLIKRDVIKKIGGLDTRFGLGNFEDDDFCIRARLAGFKAGIAEDCFVHHSGGQTFKAAEIDYRDSLNQNWEIFKRKWAIPLSTPPGCAYTVIPPRNGFDPARHYCLLTAGRSAAPSISVFQASDRIAANSKDPGIFNRDANKTIRQNNQITFRQGGNAVEPYEEIYQSIKPLLDGSNPENAIAALSNLVQSFPDFALAHNDLGVLYYQSGDKEQALEHYEQAARLEPGNVTFKKNLADFYYVEQGRVEDALTIYVDLLAINPEDVETLQITGHICVALRKFEDAKVFYNRVLEIEPWNAEAQEFLDKLQARNRESIEDKAPDEIYQQIQSQMQDNDPRTVIAALEKLAAAAPDFAPAHNDLGVLYYQSGDKEQALEHYEQAARLEPGNVTFKKNLADFYYVEQGRVEDALTIYVDLLAINPEDVETLQITGHICVALRKFEDAKVFYNRVLEIEPWNAEAQEFLEQLQLRERAV